MSKTEKLVARLLRRPSDFSYSELARLLAALGYREDTKGRTSGSRVAWMNDGTQHIIRLHKPHPGSILKKYQIDLLIEELNKEGLLK